MKILVLGYFGYKTNQLDGQTVKTRTIYHLIKRHSLYPDNIAYFDMQEVKLNKMATFGLLKKLFNTTTLIYNPAENNIKYLFPFIFLLSKIRNFSINYFVVGGWLSDFLNKSPLHKFLLGKINTIFPETPNDVSHLRDKFHYSNVCFLPNFRINDGQLPAVVRDDKDTFKIVFMARINKMKGYELVFNLADKLCKSGLSNKISIDFYGQIQESDKNDFLSFVSQYDFIEYRGYLQPEEVYKTISFYDVMLLPTRYFTEGFPGSILDAYIAGIPVIATNWKHAADFIDDGYSGFIIPFNNCELELFQKVVELYEDKEKLENMKKNARQKSEEYSEENVWSILKNYLS